MIATLVFAGCTLAGAPADVSKISIAVLDVKTTGDVPEQLPAALSGLAASNLGRAGVFQVITQDDVRQMMGFDQMRTTLTCDDQSSCLGEIGAALGVPYILTGTLSKIGDTYVLMMALIDINSAKPVGRETLSLKSEAEVLHEVDPLVARLVGPLLFSEAGQLSVSASEEGATVKVDDAVVGSTPLAAQPIAAGAHRVSVVKDGFVRWQKDVLVQPKKPLHVDALLVPSQEFLDDYKRGAFVGRAIALSLVGAGVASAGAGVALNIAHLQVAEGIRVDTKQPAGGALQVTPDQANEINALRIGSVALYVLAPVLAAGGVVVWLLGDPLDKYDEVIARANAERGAP